MKRKFRSRSGAFAAVLLLAILLAGCDKPVNLKTIELLPTDIENSSTGAKGSKGVCLVQADPPFSTFSAGPGEAIVGFDNFYKRGSEPLPCDDFRAQVFRSAVPFDLQNFNNIVSADLVFDTVKSVNRSDSETTATSPPTSHATLLGMATSQVDGIAFDRELPLPASPSFSIGVSDQVRDWIDGSHVNLGFSITGPTGLVDNNHIPENNDARLSWYGNFRLRVTYNPELNPNAPQ